MEIKSKSFDKKFKSIEELLAFGEENLKESLLTIIQGVDNNYILRNVNIDSDLSNLLGFDNNEQVKIALNGKSINVLNSYLSTAAHINLQFLQKILEFAD